MIPFNFGKIIKISLFRWYQMNVSLRQMTVCCSAVCSVRTKASTCVDLGNTHSHKPSHASGWTSYMPKPFWTSCHVTANTKCGHRAPATQPLPIAAQPGRGSRTFCSWSVLQTCRRWSSTANAFGVMRSWDANTKAWWTNIGKRRTQRGEDVSKRAWGNPESALHGTSIRKSKTLTHMKQNGLPMESGLIFRCSHTHINILVFVCGDVYCRFCV